MASRRFTICILIASSKSDGVTTMRVDDSYTGAPTIVRLLACNTNKNRPKNRRQNKQKKSTTHLERGARRGVVDDAISILRGKNLGGSKSATENMRNFLVAQPAPTQILVFGSHHDATVAG
jgi:hypothetical protein